MDKTVVTGLNFPCCKSVKHERVIGIGTVANANQKRGLLGCRVGWEVFHYPTISAGWKPAIPTVLCKEKYLPRLRGVNYEGLRTAGHGATKVKRAPGLRERFVARWFGQRP